MSTNNIAQNLRDKLLKDKIGSSTEAGLVKLYDDAGSNTDGTMTQSAIKRELDEKLDTKGDTMSGNLTVPKVIFSSGVEIY